MEKESLYVHIKAFFARIFDVRQEKEDEQETIDSLQRELKSYHDDRLLAEQIKPEVKVLFPFVREISCTHTCLIPVDSDTQKPIMLIYVKSSEKISAENKRKLTEWLSARTQVKTIKLLIENE